MATFVFNVQRDSAFIDKIKSDSTEDITMTSETKAHKVISNDMRALDSELSLPNLKFIKHAKQGGGAISSIAISIKKNRKNSI